MSVGSEAIGDLSLIFFVGLWDQKPVTFGAGGEEERWKQLASINIMQPVEEPWLGRKRKASGEGGTFRMLMLRAVSGRSGLGCRRRRE